jgi:hypothetical protein
MPSNVTHGAARIGNLALLFWVWSMDAQRCRLVLALFPVVRYPCPACDDLIDERGGAAGVKGPTWIHLGIKVPVTTGHHHH